jgi:hypothetical protein
MIHAIYRLIGIARIVVNTIKDMGRVHIEFLLVGGLLDVYIAVPRTIRGESGCGLNVFASDKKGITKAHGYDSQNEHRWQPDCKIHRF